MNFIAFSLRFPRKLKHFQRIQSETAQEVIKHSQAFFGRFERPAVVKLDNGFAFAGAGPWPRTLNSVVLFLLKEKIVPVFIAPRKPWNQASVEGANSVFARKFWHRFHFRSLQEIDEKLPSFNEAYERYHRIPETEKARTKTKALCPQSLFHPKDLRDSGQQAWIH